MRRSSKQSRVQDPGATTEAFRTSRGAQRALAVAGILLAAAIASGQPKPATSSPAQSNQSQRRIVVSIRDRKLALLEGDRVMKVYPVAVGAPKTPSPTGEFRVASRVVDPTWYWPGKTVPPGPGNPLGRRWIGLGHKGYGIHGTNEPRSIGRAASHGCIRMRNSDVEELFTLVKVGDVVELHGESDEAVARIFGSSGDMGGDSSRVATTRTGEVLKADASVQRPAPRAVAGENESQAKLEAVPTMLER